MFFRDNPRKMSGGEFLTPQPNRLVLMRAGVPHSISTVATPDGVSRLALSGFYVRPDRIAEIIKLYLPR
jgi:Rps23 Pro-64 3,4-dihydroxylase Tpa1-like proline 4-hydroxylase